MDPVARFFAQLCAMLFWGGIVGLLAKRKNRNALGWGVAGAASWFIALIALAFMPTICPKCKCDLKKEMAENHDCPTCGKWGLDAEQADGEKGI
jgi:hypothetical protein